MEKTIGLVIAGLRTLGYEAWAWDISYNETTNYKEAVELVVNKEYIKLPKRPGTLTVEWVLSKLEKADNTYKNLSDRAKAVLKGQGLGSAYPTSYGIGVFAFCSRDCLAKTKAVIEGLLWGLDYTTEYSEGGMVFRYRIGKSKANLEKLAKLFNKKMA